MKLPYIEWIKNDPKKHQFFEDGSRFLVSFGKKNDDFEVVTIDCDNDRFGLFSDSDEPTDLDWSEVNYFHLISGKIPILASEGE